MAGADSSQIRKLTQDIGAVSRGSQRKVSQAVRKTLNDIASDAKILAPVDTGNLRSSISVEVDGDGMGGEVGPTAEYGIYQEFGTSTQSGQPFLGPAFDRRSPGLEKALSQIADGLA